MKIKPYLFAAAFLFCACSVHQYNVEQHYDHPFFHTKNWSYAWFMLKDDDGKLSSAIADSNGNEVMDTTRYYWTALCPVNGDTAFHVIHYAFAKLDHENLLLQIAEGTASTNDELWIKIVKGKVNTMYSTVFFFYYDAKNVYWETIRQNLTLDRKDFQPGDTIKGYIDFACVEHWKNQSPATEWTTKDDTIRLEGPFKCVIAKK